MIRIVIDVDPTPDAGALIGDITTRAAYNGMTAVVTRVDPSQPPFAGATHFGPPVDDPDATQAGGPPPPVATREGSRRG